jgi:dolichol-phosphate mannosyltransferase
MIKFSRRFGQPAATIAGIRLSQGARVAVIDADLQDPPELLFEMYQKMNSGYDVVYGQRVSRKGETMLKKLVSWIGYRVINKSSEVSIPANVGDFRMMSRRVVNELNLLTEQHGFLRGLVSFIGFNQTEVKYTRDERSFGIGHYNRYLGSLRIGMNGLISFSSKPLVLMSLIGAGISFASFVVGGVYLTQKILGFDLNPGLPTMVILITFLAGIQISSLGLIGQYISRIYDEVKARPMYIVDSTKNLD